MSRTSLATPCPAPSASLGHARRFTTISNTEDTCTTDIDYTRALGQDFRNAKPRRKSTFLGRPKKHAELTIFEDVLEDELLEVQSVQAEQKSTLLARPAQRLRRDVSRTTEAADLPAPAPLGEIGQPRTRKPTVATAANDRPTPQAETNAGLRKNPRRRTIFVPAEDTTMVTIHPGANTTKDLDDTFALPAVPRPTASLQPLPIMQDAQPAFDDAKPIRKVPRMSLSAAPKRLPLQTTFWTSNLPATDVPGHGGGKENMPPGYAGPSTYATQKLEMKVVAEKQTSVRSRLFEPTASSQARQAGIPRNAVPQPKPRAQQVFPRRGPVTSSQPVSNSTGPRAVGHMPVNSSPVQPVIVATKPATVTKRSPLTTRPRSIDLARTKLSKYPVLTENIVQPQLYVDAHLSNEEVAITALINEVFARSQPTLFSSEDAGDSLRARMLAIYQQPRVATLHARLQASLQFGALSRPKDMPSPPDPTMDLGLRKRFLNLLLNTYEQGALKAAAEVVVGRQAAGSRPSSLSSAGDSLDSSKSKRALIGFLETFFVTVDDLEDNEVDHTGSPEQRRWRKMALRSLMLIWLLDRSKTESAVSGCLFKKSSPQKTTTSVLHALSGLLIPSIGDVTRPLRYLDYDVGHVQDPLDEVEYKVKNLAVDLRDGIQLARLAEMLMFCHQCQRCDHNFAADASVTIQLPDLTLLESIPRGERYPRILSQHLKMPCLGRAQKVYNVQVALSAIGAHGSCDVIGITANDIVDGHREKTLNLLRSLLSQYVLSALVDFSELEKDINRVARHTHRTVHAVDSDLSEREQTLLDWASAHCATHNLRITNLTTSFADGAAYTAILSSFPTVAVPVKVPSTTSSIPSKTTTVATLTLLASHILPLSRRQSAALLMQRAYRCRLAWRRLRVRVILAKMARECAKVVDVQKRIVGAAVVLQRAWRSVVEKRERRRFEEVAAFQELARGWMKRREVKQKLKEVERRRLGGYEYETAALDKERGIGWGGW